MNQFPASEPPGPYGSSGPGPLEPYGQPGGPGPAPQPAPAGPPLGWYPVADGTQRWWDGTAWTGHVAPGPGPAMASRDDNTLALVAHLGGAFGSILVPILIYALRRDQSPYIRHHAAEAINFHLSIFLYMIVSFVLMLVLIGFVLLFVVVILFYVFTIMASIAASRGEWYRYPLTLRFVS